MIIKLRLKQSEITSMNPAERTEFFEKLVVASRRGNHRILIHKGFAEWASRKQFFSERVKSHFDRLDRRSYESYNNVTKNHVHLVVRKGDISPSLTNQYELEIGHKNIVNGNYLKPTALLVENKKNDGELYKIMFKIKKSTFSKLLEPLNYEVKNGNGSEITNKLEILIDEKRIVCCICDSDKFTPDGEFGATYGNTIEQFPKNGSELYFVTMTPCHEAENFLTIDIIRNSLFERIEHFEKKNSKKFHQKISNLKENISDLNEIECKLNKQCNHESRLKLWFFLDIKLGINIKNDKIQNISSVEKDWLRVGYCENSFSDIDIPGLGEKILKAFRKSNKAKGEFRAHMRSDQWPDHFSNWIDSIIWYLCGQERHNW